MTQLTNGKISGDPIGELLPWYATGRLDYHERLAVEEALERRPELRQQLELIRAEIAETVRLNDLMPALRPGATARFLQRLEQETAPAPKTAPDKGFRQWIGWLLESLAGGPRWALAAGAVALIIQTAAIGALVAERQATVYRTAGGPQEQAAATLVLARFADAAPLATVAGKLAALGITIADGPKAGGLFTLRIGPASMPAPQRDKMIAALKSDTVIMFVAPVE